MQPQGNKSEGTLADILKSPLQLAILLGGFAIVLGGVYLALQTLPGISNPVTGEPSAPKGNPNAGIDFEELNNLPEDIAAAAGVILSQEEPVLPEPLMELPEASGFGLVYPVTEAVESVQPVLSWTLFSPGPFRISVVDAGGKTVASAQNVPNLSILVPARLTPGAIYTWQVTAANGDSEQASFIVMRPDDVAEWQRVRSQFAQSHLALGLAAEFFGLLTVAEREYEELGRQFPNAEAPFRLYTNVTALRD